MKKTASRDAIVKFCRDYLDVSKFEDYCHNGMQVQGKEEVRKIVTGVSLSQDLLRAAISKKADMVMVHHGLFGSSIPHPPVITGFVRDRLTLLLSNDITLCGFHLPLDGHPVIGNNTSLCKLLGAGGLEKLDIGFVGTLKSPMPFESFVERVEKLLSTSCFTIGGGKKVKRVGIISGGASGYFQQALEAKADTFICGEIVESNVKAIEETGLNFISAGHYNTEKLGIQNLGNLVSKKFGVPVEFVDVPCEI